jgi:uracil-DNA glycosylase family 4
MRIQPHGPKTARIAIVGEAPGETEERLSRFFVGASGQLLRQLMSTAKLSLDNCYLTNVSKVRPEHNDFQSRFYTRTGQPTSELLGYYQELALELQEVKANVFVAVGNEALKALTGLDGIQYWRGSILETQFGKVIPVIHPARILRAAGASDEIVVEGKSKGKNTYGDLVARCTFDFHKVARESLFPECKLPNPTLITKPTYHEAMDYLRSIQKGHTVSEDIEVYAREIDCIGLSYSENHAICIPFFWVPGTGYTGPATGTNYFTAEEEADIWRELYRINSDPDINKVYQNANFDLTFLTRHGLPISHLYMDTMNAHHCCYPETPKSLEFICSVYTRYPYYKDQIKGQRWKYNCLDAVVTETACFALEKELRDLGVYDFYFNLINKVVLPYKEVADTGLRVDPALKQQITEELEAKLEACKTSLNDTIGHEINMASPAQVKQLLYTELGLPEQYQRRTKGQTEDKVTTNEEAIEKLLKKATTNHQHDVLKAILEFRDLHKELTTYARLPLDADNRCRTTYVVSGTETGRLSSNKTVTDTGANLQNIPKGELTKGCGYGIRSFFIPDSDSDIFIEGDLSGADARIVAWISQDPGLVTLFASGKDVHIANSCLFFGGEYEEKYAAYKSGDPVIEKQRKNSKTYGHGCNYDMGWKHLMEEAGVSAAEAKRIMALYHATYIGIGQWHRAVQAQLELNRTLQTPLGRKRTFFGRWGNDLFKEAYAYVPQSTVADIIHYGFLALYNRIKETGLDKLGVRVALNIHDAITCNTPKQYALQTLQLMRQTMHIPLTFPHGTEIVPVDFGWGERWFGFKSVKPETEEMFADWAKEVAVTKQPKLMWVRENGKFIQKEVLV